jgi:hypothetical protein
MYRIEDVTDRYSADHITTLGAAPFPSDKPDELYLINGMENFETAPSQILVVDSIGSKPSLTVAPKQRPLIGSGNYTNLKRRRKTAGLSGLSQSQSNLGFLSFDIPGIELDEGVETALGGLAALLATGIGLYGIYFVAKPILGLIGDTRKAFRSFKN